MRPDIIPLLFLLAIFAFPARVSAQLRSIGGPCVSCGKFIAEGEYHDFLGCAGLRSGNNGGTSPQRRPQPRPGTPRRSDPTEQSMQSIIRDVDNNGSLYNQTTNRNQKLYHLQRMSALLDRAGSLKPGDSRVTERRRQVSQLLENWHENTRRLRIQSQLQQAGRIRNAVLQNLANLNADAAAIEANAATSEIDSLLDSLRKDPGAQPFTPTKEPHPAHTRSRASRSPAGTVIQITGDAWAAMTQAPHLDASVVDLRDATTLTVDPAKVRAIAIRKPRETNALMKKLLKELRTLPPENRIDVMFRKFDKNLDQDLPDLEVDLEKLSEKLMQLPTRDQAEMAAELYRELLQLPDGDFVIPMFTNSEKPSSVEQFKDDFIHHLQNFYDELGESAIAAASARQLSPHSPVYPGDSFATALNSRVQLSLNDKSGIIIDPDSVLQLTEFAFDPAVQAGKFAAVLTKGTIHYVSGDNAHFDSESVQLALPTGTVTPRGTEILLQVDAKGTSHIAVLRGEAHFRSHTATKGKTSVIVPEGHLVDISRGGKIGHVLAFDKLGFVDLASVDRRAPALHLLETVFWIEDLFWWQILAKATLSILGLASILGWIWEPRQRLPVAMLSGAFVGIGLLALSAWWL